ncbi:ankyrin repeat domain-containing protein [Legionella micdadei]|uniref:Ankyrin repeat-containing protein n=2 Tax=Legionella micdadei TaxID=451 RepID=A0A098GJ41_LEGMI|nr:ankyrin repeat domain-containing protein [Legionella micdadei]ARG96607.1 hypothetical protein B6N58_02345 [Legionella micdadei]KTD29347.1 Ankyrin repeats (3 copies) [Legionella micdadei]NSL18894.1 ankyrin repeat domain-containing protein [Legionella micdadei]CEG62027.1 protein of unknown function [ankyrin repeat] [Legionella micdadei]SCY77447.1 Ankyrin repeat-containing protein [Legionella micdadei]
MRFSLYKLITLSSKLEINFGNGPCIGFDALLAMAFMSNKQDIFYKILNTIGKYKSMGYLARDIDSAILKIALRKGNKKDLLLYSIKEFLTSIAKVCELQYSGFKPAFDYSRYIEHKLLFSDHAQQIGGLHSFEKVVILDEEEITELFEALEPLISAIQPLCLCIESHDHDIFISYDIETRLWQVTDINDLDGETDDYYLSYGNASIAGAVLDCFADQDTCLMKIKFITPASIESKNIKQLKDCLGKFARIDEQRVKMTNCDGVGLLYLEAQRGNLSKVNQLLALGADPNQSSCSKRFGAAFIACENGHLEVLKALLEKGANLNATTKDGNTLLLTACMSHQWHVAEYLLAHTDIDVNLCNNEGITALHLAVCNQQKRLCAQLIEKKANIHAVAPEIGTPLEIAGFLKNQAIESCFVPTPTSTIVTVLR